ncbi:MAG TPA: VOC family protein [Pseudonocardiaceae bacterium]
MATAGPRLAFHQEPEGKTVKNRVHLDLITTDLDGESARLSTGPRLQTSGLLLAHGRFKIMSAASFGVQVDVHR